MIKQRGIRFVLDRDKIKSAVDVGIRILRRRLCLKNGYSGKMPMNW